MKVAFHIRFHIPLNNRNTELTNYGENNERTTLIVIYTKTFRPKNIGLRWFKKLTKITSYLTAHSASARPAKCNERTCVT